MNNYANTLHNPEKFADFYYDIADDCSDCFGARRLYLDSTPALMQGFVFDSGAKEVEIEYVRDDRKVSISFDYASTTVGIPTMVERFIGNFHLIPERNIVSSSPST